MNGQKAKLCWASLAATPIAACWVDEWDFAGITAAVYLIGWLPLWRATLRDPHGQLLSSALRSPAVPILGMLVFVAGQVLLFISSKALILVLMLGTLVLLFQWSLARSAIQLRSRLGRLSLAVVTFGVSLAAVEVTLRATQWNQPQNGNGWTWGHPIRLNSSGFRDREIVVPKAPNAFRVMVLGDSLTWGAGLAVEQRYTQRLEQLLIQSQPRADIEVLNFGLPAAPTTTEFVVLSEHMDRVDPNVVVVGFCVNDVQPNAQGYAVELDRFRALFKLYRSLGKHLGATQLANFLHLRTDNLLRRCGAVPSHNEALDRCYQPESAEWKTFRKTLDQMLTLCNQRQLPPPVFIPLLQGNGDYNNPDENLAYILEWSRRAAQCARELGLTVVDTEGVFFREGHRNRQVNLWDGHPDSQCNQLYASQLAPVVLSHLRHHQAKALTSGVLQR